MLAGTRPNIDNIVGCHHGFFVVFHHNQGIAQVPHLSQRLNETGVIALVETDRRLIQDIEDPAEVGTNLGGQTNTLRFPT